jgi:hypothetical protein
MVVPSNDVMFQSLGVPATGVATTDPDDGGGWQEVLVSA